MSVLVIFIVWLAVRYLNPKFSPNLYYFEKYENFIRPKLAKFNLQPEIAAAIILVIPLVIFLMLYHLIKDIIILKFIVNIIVLWSAWSYRPKFSILPNSPLEQEKEILFNPINGYFTVIIWFLLAGSIGVLFYDFVRKMSLQPLKSILEWPAARILGLGYAIAGHFSPVFSYCCSNFFSHYDNNQNYLYSCGRLALYGSTDAPHIETPPVNAKALLRRAQIMLFLILLIFSTGSLL